MMNSVFTNKTIVRNSIMDPKTFKLQLVNSKKEHLCCIIPFSIQDYFDKGLIGNQSNDDKSNFEQSQAISYCKCSLVLREYQISDFLTRKARGF